VKNYNYLKQAFNRMYGSWGLTYGICQFIDKTYSGYFDIIMDGKRALLGRAESLLPYQSYA
jgi:ribose 1,5-bisphosphokinase PhnN